MLNYYTIRSNQYRMINRLATALVSTVNDKYRLSNPMVDYTTQEVMKQYPEIGVEFAHSNQPSIVIRRIGDTASYPTNTTSVVALWQQYRERTDTLDIPLDSDGNYIFPLYDWTKLDSANALFIRYYLHRMNNILAEWNIPEFVKMSLALACDMVILECPYTIELYEALGQVLRSDNMTWEGVYADKYFYRIVVDQYRTTNETALSLEIYDAKYKDEYPPYLVLPLKSALRNMAYHIERPATNAYTHFIQLIKTSGVLDLLATHQYAELMNTYVLFNTIIKRANMKPSDLGYAPTPNTLEPWEENWLVPDPDYSKHDE